MSWFSKPGDTNREKFSQDTNVRSLFKFWLNKGEKKKIIFIGDERIGVHEHNIQMGPKKWEQYTCSRTADCYWCGTKSRSNYVEYSTVLDLTPYTNKDGVEKKYSRKAFPASGLAIDVLNRRRQEKGGSLAGYMVEVARDGEKSPSVGNDFNVIGEKPDLSKLPPMDVKLIEYEKCLQPLPAEKIKAILNFSGAHVGTTARAEVVAAVESSEDIPF